MIFRKGIILNMVNAVSVIAGDFIKNSFLPVNSLNNAEQLPQSISKRNIEKASGFIFSPVFKILFNCPGFTAKKTSGEAKKLNFHKDSEKIFLYRNTVGMCVIFCPVTSYPKPIPCSSEVLHSIPGISRLSSRPYS